MQFSGTYVFRFRRPEGCIGLGEVEKIETVPSVDK